MIESDNFFKAFSCGSKLQSNNGLLSSKLLKSNFFQLKAKKYTTNFFKTKLSIIEHRSLVAEKLKCPFYSPPNITQETLLMPQGDSIGIAIEIYRPEKLDITKKVPTTFYIPGTGFVANENRSFTQAICGNFAEITGGQVISIHHRLAPENPFPAAYKDVCYVLDSLLEQSDLDIDVKKTVLVGYSSGGNLGALAAIHGASKKIPLPLKEHILVSPMVDLSREFSYGATSVYDLYKKLEGKKQCVNDDFAFWLTEMYVPKYFDLKNPSLSPYWVHEERLKKIAPTIAPLTIFVGEKDLLRRDAQAYFEKFIKAGIPAKLYVAKGEDHSCLWQNINFVKAVGAHIKNTFSSSQLDKITTAFSKPILFDAPRPPSKVVFLGASNAEQGSCLSSPAKW